MPPSREGNRFLLLDPAGGKDPATVKMKSPISTTKKRRFVAFNEAFPQLPETTIKPEEEAKFIVIKPAENGESLVTVNPFILAQTIKGISTGFSKTKMLRDGSMLLLCNSTKIADLFINKLEKIHTTKVKAFLHKELNSTKGVIYSHALKYTTESIIEENMKSEGVTNAHHIAKASKWDTENKKQPTGLVVLTFDRFTLPKYVYVGLERCEVREYIPNPMRCSHCTKIGHTIKRCMDKQNNLPETCGECCNQKVEGHICTKKACLNCKVIGHPTSDRNCPKYMIEREVIKLQLKQKLTRYEARRLYYQLNPAQPSMDFKSFADAIKNAETSSEQVPSTPNRPDTNKTSLTTSSTNITAVSNSTQEIDNNSTQQQQRQTTKNIISQQQTQNLQTANFTLYKTHQKNEADTTPKNQTNSSSQQQIQNITSNKNSTQNNADSDSIMDLEIT